MLAKKRPDYKLKEWNNIDLEFTGQKISLTLTKVTGTQVHRNLFSSTFGEIIVIMHANTRCSVNIYVLANQGIQEEKQKAGANEKRDLITTGMKCYPQAHSLEQYEMLLTKFYETP